LAKCGCHTIDDVAIHISKWLYLARLSTANSRK
jgi:hypothetical protein